MSIELTDAAALQQLMLAQAVMLLSPGANQLSLCCASSVSLRTGLKGALVLASVVALLAGLSVTFGRTLSGQEWLIQQWLFAGALYLAAMGARKLAAALRGQQPAGVAACSALQVAGTALSNPLSLAFYVSMVVPVTASHGGPAFAGAVVLAMTATAALVYGAFAVAFAAPALRRILETHRRGTDAVVGTVLLVLAARLSMHILPA